MTRASDTARLLGAGGTFGGAITSNSGIVIDDITIDGTEIDLSSGDITLDAGGDIKLDVAGGDIKFLFGGTEFGEIRNISNDLTIISSIADKDIVFKGQDSGSEIEAMRIDMSNEGAVTIQNSSGGSGLILHRDFSGSNVTSNTNTAQLNFSMSDSATANQIIAQITPQATAGTGDAFGGIIRFNTANSSGTPTERMQIDSSGRLLVGTTTTTLTNTSGLTVQIGGSGNTIGLTTASQLGGVAFIANRNSDDGTVIQIRQANGVEGSISVSGNTTSYNAFSGSHWSRLSDNSKPTILKGTVIENIDEMCDWYRVKFTVAKTEETEEYTEQVSIALPSGKKEGDTISYTHEGITYDDAVIVKEDDNKHTKCKISDTADSKRVYGVFADWDSDDDTVNDMYVTALGTHVVRINKDITVQAGDLLSSNGDGTAKVQDDDIIRSKTIGKVLTNIKQETYNDGSYTVPCALYCG